MDVHLICTYYKLYIECVHIICASGCTSDMYILNVLYYHIMRECPSYRPS